MPDYYLEHDGLWIALYSIFMVSCGCKVKKNDPAMLVFLANPKASWAGCKEKICV